MMRFGITLLIFFTLLSCQKNEDEMPTDGEVENPTTGNSCLTIDLKERTVCLHPNFTTESLPSLNDFQGCWLIPDDQIRDGGPGKDGIPSIDVPVFAPVTSIDFMQEEDLIIGVKAGDEIRGYPHPILDWHEIVNDEFDFVDEANCNVYLAVNYCPLTGTAIAWNRRLQDEPTTFGVSGLLYNTNLIPYDRQSNSNWSQMRLDCVEGDRIGEQIETYPLIEMSWSAWKQRFPKSMILNTETGFSRAYGQYPYGNYKVSNALLFPVNHEDNRLPSKERVLGVIADYKAKVYRFESLDQNTDKSIEVIEDSFKGRELVIVGSKRENFLIAFQRELEDGTLLNFKAAPDGEEAILLDQEGNSWNIFGEAIAGPRTGEYLKIPRSYIGYFFSWAAFYGDVEIYEG